MAPLCLFKCLLNGWTTLTTLSLRASRYAGGNWPEETLQAKASFVVAQNIIAPLTIIDYCDSAFYSGCPFSSEASLRTAFHVTAVVARGTLRAAAV